MKVMIYGQVKLDEDEFNEIIDKLEEYFTDVFDGEYELTFPSGDMHAVGNTNEDPYEIIDNLYSLFFDTFYNKVLNDWDQTRHISDIGFEELKLT